MAARFNHSVVGEWQWVLTTVTWGGRPATRASGARSSQQNGASMESCSPATHAAMRSLLAAAFFALALSFAPVVQASWGLASGRADASDVSRLALDVGRVLNAERQLNLRREVQSGILGIDRQRQLLGLEPDASLGDLYRAKRQWWVENVLQPALDIAANPAASCALARSMIEVVGRMTKQGQFLGLDEEEFGAFGNGTEILLKSYTIAHRRCLEESYDECRLTGNVLSFWDIIGAYEKERQQYLGDDPSLTELISYLIRRCAVFKLNYRMSIDNKGMASRSEWLGGYILLFRWNGALPTMYLRIVKGYWEAPRPFDREPPDILLLQSNCPKFLSACERMPPEDEPHDDGTAFARLTMKRTIIEQTWRVVIDTPTDRILGGRAIIERTERVVGNDDFELHFEPPTVHLWALGQDGERRHLQPPAGTDWYERATRHVLKGDFDAPRVGSWTREGYPLVYKAVSAEQAREWPFTAERTEFEIVHRPDLFPQDEINPEYEVAETQPQPERIPATDGLGPFRN